MDLDVAVVMIRNALSKLAVQRSVGFWKRPYHVNWRAGERNEKENTYREYLTDLWNRRVMLGPDEPQPRSKQFLWNYNSELFAFGKRLGEEFELRTLRRAFRHASFEPLDDERENETVVDEGPSTSNDELIAAGEKIMNVYVPAYLRYHFPKLPEEGIRAIATYLCSNKQLAYLARNLGMYDLILASDFPYDDVTVAKTFRAVVGGLLLDSGEPKAEFFVQDFVLTELIDVDVNEIFYVKNPMGILASMLEKSGRGAPEPRILRQTGTFTVTPVYLIGIFVDGKILGQAPGESTQTAEEMAARDCLKTLWDTQMERRSPLTFGPEAGRALDLRSYKNRKNESLRTFFDFEDEANLVGDAFGDEPFNLEEMYQRYKNEIEPTLGRVYRRHYDHRFRRGTIFKYCRRAFIAPNVKTI